MARSDHTKERFAAALKELSRTKPLNRISVHELICTCGMNRSTFYYHFLDRDDLVRWIFYNDIIQPNFEDGAVQWRSGVLAMYTHFQEDCEFYRQALAITGEHSLQQEIYRTFYDLTTRYIRTLSAVRPSKQAGIDYIARFYSHAAARVSIDYIKTGAPQTPQWMTDRFFDVIWPGLPNAVKNMLDLQQ